MATVGDVFQLTLKASYLGQSISNVFFYYMSVATSSNPYAAALANLFVDEVLSSIAAFQSDQLVYSEIYCVNVGTPLDMVVLPLSETGAIDAELDTLLPSYIAAKFRFTRSGAGQRYGYKRFAGLNDTLVNGNIASAAMTAFGLTCASNLDDPLIGGSGTTLNPFVASRPITLGVIPSGYIPQGCQFSGITTQNSRKP